jgi:hypothetical protein
MNTGSFSRFLAANPPERAQPVTDPSLVTTIEDEFGITIPGALDALWSIVGTGYLGERRLFVYPVTHVSGRGEPGRDIVSWNRDPGWRLLYPEPAKGGPLFFAETCFGDQIGYRSEEDRTIPILLVLDTCESFVIGDDLEDLFTTVLTDPFGIIDPARWTGVRSALGPLENSTHYAPIVSPLVGGSDSIDNFQLIDAVVHMRTAIAEFDALSRLDLA